MTAPRLTIVIPTCGRPTLARTLRSIRDQPGPLFPEVLIVGDTFDETFAEALAPVPALADAYDASYFTRNGGAHCWGHPQRTAGQQAARGAWLLFSQDDSVLTRPALAAIARHITAPGAGPALFQVETWQAGCIPRLPQVACGNVDADCLLVPNEPARLPLWGTDYEADFAYIRAVAKQWPVLTWPRDVISIGRPERQPWPATLLDPNVLR